MSETNERYGPYMETISGKRFYYLDPHPDDIFIDDIASSLANTCRFNGHTLFYSVAEHSCYVAAQVPEEIRLEALLHDAAEAYVGDVASPLKRLLPDYRKMEERIQHIIYDKFDIKPTKESRELIKQADLEQLRKEAFYLMPSKGKDYSFGDTGVVYLEEDDGNPLRIPRCVSPQVAYIMFQEAFRMLTEDEVEWMKDIILEVEDNDGQRPADNQ